MNTQYKLKFHDNIRCKLGFHDMGEPLRIGKDIWDIWNCENIDHTVRLYIKYVRCLRCGKILWEEITEEQYKYYREHGYNIEVNEGEKDITPFSSEAEKYGWKLDEEYER